MKQILFFLSALFLFTSCSNELEVIPDNDDTKKYPISFNVSGFSIESSELKSQAADQKTLIYTIYHANSEVYTTKKIPLSGDSFEINEELPIGIYKIIFLVGYDNYMYELRYQASNFNTDIFEGMWSKQGKGATNIGVYHKNTYFVISDDSSQNVPIDITLNPMWSLLNLNVTDANSFIAPARANHIQFESPQTSLAFYLKDGRPAMPSPVPVFLYSRIGLGDFRNGNGIDNIPIGYNPGAKLTLLFYADGDSWGLVEYIGKKEFWTGAIEYGKIYTLKGELGDATTDPMEQDFTITYSGLEEVPEIPF